jgi:hypothetical protein
VVSRRIMAMVASAVVIMGVWATGSTASAANLCPTGGKAISKIAYHLVGPAGDRSADKLQGATAFGDQVTVNFKVLDSCPLVTLTLASYRSETAPPFTLEEAQAQTLFDHETNIFTPGSYQLVADIPPADITSFSPETDPIQGTTIAWDGVHGAPKLPTEVGSHWLLVGTDGATNAVFTINGTTYQMVKHGSVWSAEVPGPLTGSESISATFSGGSADGAFLTLSSSSHYQIDFVAAPLQDPPQYRLLVPRVGIGSDVG